MDLEKLFQTQKVLRDKINYNESDRLNKLVLALLVELGECANEWRGFKFWSKDQMPRIFVPIHKWIEGLKRVVGHTNPLLEEYVDGLHFVLELGLEWGFQDKKPFLVHIGKTEEMFLRVYKCALLLKQCGTGRYHKEFYFGELLSNYLGLGKALGFTWEEVEEAYMNKNAINHKRQDSGVY
ncbi:dimeric dUTPase (all-alpha-NTP-PPase superfamily) [Bacillus pakistanensis]|uniref:Dimeric dUTPase (All-alpha-NTP-PPase superfamily) n=1 Tax=Rossellomorea pakistanensis TaxID=992288 RepID=A0ABS2ND89_9BACI|nr:dUTP diphosphatase [Bacillus pakistanensis]MBM7585824.1 dimeric dUTPase (all-alpha-NTP-PPase superfamily) [Bacillus pakistanensis]